MSVAWWREPTRGQWASFAAAWAGWVLDAFDFTIFLLVMPEIASEFGVEHHRHRRLDHAHPAAPPARRRAPPAPPPIAGAASSR